MRHPVAYIDYKWFSTFCNTSNGESRIDDTTQALPYQRFRRANCRWEEDARHGFSDWLTTSWPSVEQRRATAVTNMAKMCWSDSVYMYTSTASPRITSATTTVAAAACLCVCRCDQRHHYHHSEWPYVAFSLTDVAGPALSVWIISLRFHLSQCVHLSCWIKRLLT